MAFHAFVVLLEFFLIVLATCGIRRPELACENSSSCSLLLVDSLS